MVLIVENSMRLVMLFYLIAGISIAPTLQNQ